MRNSTLDQVTGAVYSAYFAFGARLDYKVVRYGIRSCVWMELAQVL